ncbi:MAG: nucleotide exchange factor GrpE [Rhodoglobus sp.]
MPHKKNPSTEPDPADDQGPEIPKARSGRRASSPVSDSDAPVEGEEASASAPEAASGGTISDADQALLDQASIDLVADMRSDMLRAQAELVNFRSRVERDRAANRDTVIAEVIRALLPALDDLALAEAHGDLVEGAPMAIVAQKLRSAFEKYGLSVVGAKGEIFDPALHEAVVQLPAPGVTVNTIAEVISAGYMLSGRLVRPAKVAVSVPEE